MAKQKKKNAQLSALNKAFAIAGMFPSKQPADFKKYLAHFRENTKAKRAAYGYSECPSAPPLKTDGNMALWNHVRSEEHAQDCMALGRDLVLDSWYSNKRVFTFPKETVDYILDEFPFLFLEEKCHEYVRKMCIEPVFLEYPSGIPVSVNTDGIENGHRLLYGIFAGQCYLENETLYGGASDYTLGIQVTKEVPYLLVHATDKRSTAYSVLNTERNDFYRLMLRTLAYLYFLYGKKDAIGSALIPQTRQGAAECFEVRPVPFSDSMPNEKDPNSIVVAGLCTAMGFLSRKNMVIELEKIRIATEGYGPYMTAPANPEQEASAVNYLRHKSVEMILSWERYRAIYQFDTDTVSALRDKYHAVLALDGIALRLLKYLPQQTIVLHDTDTNAITLVSIVPYTDDNGTPNQPGIFMDIIQPNDISMAVLPCHCIIQKLDGSLNAANQGLDAITALYHLLSVYEAKALKKLTKDILLAGDPNSTVLVPVPPQPETTHVPVDQDATEEVALYRMGQTISDVPFELYTLTPRTVKRARQEERIIRMGWKMTPHTRRPHPHRYWVGHGAEKHLEVRWVERIQVHKEQTAETTTLHILKE